MAQFEIEVECFLGMSHCGGMMAENKGAVELSDEDVATLVSLIREKKTDDIEELELEEKYPEIYEKLYDAYSEIADDAVDDHWYWRLFCSGEFEYDVDDLIDYCKEHHGFSSEYDYLCDCDEDEIKEGDPRYDFEVLENFDIWFGNLMERLTLAERRKIFEGPLAMELGEYGADPDDYEIKIPKGILELVRSDW